MIEIKYNGKTAQAQIVDEVGGEGQMEKMNFAKKLASSVLVVRGALSTSARVYLTILHRRTWG
jgi:hypothetical protein